ncbi:MAG: hypothetical protein A3F12_02770 [Gammaproteobacteria bacterium RIFCSPHIGHO2_12_FULL_38_14]|nr:MAG: hypothetical protein A3F12_02770 [Gammaproteobacteria bacterium RIFCSPHIGHO2_12_FULL_38_14]
MKNIGGRPIKFTNSVLEDIIYGIAQGFTLKASCKFAGVSYSTLAWWLAKGKQAKQSNIKNKYSDVLERINQATYAEKIKHRNNFFLTFKPRDFRYGWRNPMPLRTRQKISAFWQKRKLKFICGNQL